MTAGTQCDNCRVFAPPHPPGWFFLGQQPGEEEAPSALSVLFGRSPEPLAFCTIACLADWAFVQKLAAEASAGSEPGL